MCMKHTVIIIPCCTLSQIIMFYTLHLYRAIYQLCLNKTGRKNRHKVEKVSYDAGPFKCESNNKGAHVQATQACTVLCPVLFRHQGVVEIKVLQVLPARPPPTLLPINPVKLLLRLSCSLPFCPQPPRPWLEACSGSCIHARSGDERADLMSDEICALGLKSLRDTGNKQFSFTRRCPTHSDYGVP